jgi:hypothetical protein
LLIFGEELQSSSIIPYTILKLNNKHKIMAKIIIITSFYSTVLKPFNERLKYLLNQQTAVAQLYTKTGLCTAQPLFGN